MEATAPTTAPRTRLSAGRIGPLPAGDSVAGWLLAVALVVYLGLSSGGYDLVVRSQVGVVIWWVILLGILIGVLPRADWNAGTWVAFALLAAYFGWTWLGTRWTSNVEQTLVEVGRVATYIGVFVLAACLAGRGAGRAMVLGLATGIAIVCAVAILSKLLPSLYPTNPANRYYLTPRLSYPFDYSDGVGEFAALGIPLLWYVASSARSVWGRALGGAGLPVVLLCLGMTVSRGGILAAAVAVVVFLALSPDRIPRLASGVIAAVAIAVLMVALLMRNALANSPTVAPAGQRHSMLVIVVIVVVAAGLAQGILALLGRRRARPAWTRVSRSAARITGTVIASLVIAGVIALITSGAGHHLWEQFKRPTAPRSTGSYVRLLSVAGSHRYQYWQVAIHAFHGSPWHGIGPGTFQFYWAQHQKLGEYVLNAHSLWIETLAELGIVGLVLLVCFFLWTVVGGAVRSFSYGLQARALTVTAVAGVAAFCAAAAFDWDWQIAVIPFVMMFLAAVCLAGADRDQSAAAARRSTRRRRFLARCLLAVCALVALWGILIPLGAASAVRASQRAASRGQLIAALRDADSAQQLEPSAATPRLQRALVLEQLGDVGGAAQAIDAALRRAPTDWTIWLVGSRIATEQNRPAIALRDYRRARSLNPRSPIFGG